MAPDATSPAETERLTHPKYRPDIDGLRAVAVLSVVGFHAFPEIVRGGFVGVDVFFVISGYLISTIIFTNLGRGSFSFAEFYTRRIRRIFPALALVLLFCLVAGWMLLLSEEFRLLGKHVAAGAGFVSNIILWRESGYFDPAAEAKPLLHLWSLGIEEQFYIVWPLLLWLVWKGRRSFFTATLLVGILSFAANILTYRKAAIANFYSPQSRFWELLIGAGLAYLVIHRGRTVAAGQALARRFGGGVARLATADRLAALGALLIAFAIAVLSKSRHFPGFWALLPTLGAALIIWAGPEARFNRAVLSHPLMVWFGLISFPLYLWHWPLLAFPRILEGQAPEAWVRLGAVALSILLAWLTFRFVERPLRFGGGGRLKAIGLAGAILVLGVSGLAIFQMKGLPSRPINDFGAVKLGTYGHDAFFDAMSERHAPCADASLRTAALLYEGHIRCFQSRPGDGVDIALIGDSHAEHLFPGLAEALPGRTIAYYIKAATPLISVPDYRAIYARVLQDSAIRTVIIAAHWKTRQTGLGLGRNFEAELADTLRRLGEAGKRVYLVDDVPDFAFDPSRCKLPGLFGKTRTCSQPAAAYEATVAATVPVLERAAAGVPGVRLLRIGPGFCSGGACAMEQQGVLFYRDDNHLNLEGSRHVGRLLLQQAPGLAD